MMDGKRPEVSHVFTTLLAPKWWRCVTHFPLRYVTMPGFFDPLWKGLAVDDRVDIYAAGEGGAHAVLIVDAIGPETGNRVKVSLLQEFKRQ